MAMAATPDPERGRSRHPTFALWPVSLREDLRQALTDGVRKVIAWTDRHGCASVTFGTDPIDPFFNVNTPDDLARAKQMLQELAT
jgi:molybdopterin-guanine dinucleotide biosynthesis protein A